MFGRRRAHRLHEVTGEREGRALAVAPEEIRQRGVEGLGAECIAQVMVTQASADRRRRIKWTMAVSSVESDVAVWRGLTAHPMRQEQ